MRTPLLLLSLVGCRANAADDASQTAALADPTLPTADAGADAGHIVEFHIPAGTGTSSWNTQGTELHVAIGQVLRIVNDDSIGHRLHTDDDKPCAHGDEMATGGGSYDCVIIKAFDSAGPAGPLHDHDNYNARFWAVAR